MFSNITHTTDFSLHLVYYVVIERVFYFMNFFSYRWMVQGTKLVLPRKDIKIK